MDCMERGVAVPEATRITAERDAWRSFVAGMPKHGKPVQRQQIQVQVLMALCWISEFNKNNISLNHQLLLILINSKVKCLY